MKQLTAQNEKLRDTLVKMRDLSAHEKSEIMRLTKDLDEKQHQAHRFENCTLHIYKDLKRLLLILFKNYFHRNTERLISSHYWQK
jgi:hypothetical protein